MTNNNDNVDISIDHSSNDKSYLDIFDEVTDHIANRVVFSTMLGASFGMASATLKGQHNIMKSTFHAGVSSALAMTACFAAERMGYYLVGGKVSTNNNGDSKEIEIYREMIHASNMGNVKSHLLGGILGGAFVSQLYLHRPIPGILFFPPIMLGAYALDYKIDEYRRQRIMATIIDNEEAPDEKL